MAEPGDTLAHKLPFLFVTLLVSANLAVISIKIAKVGTSPVRDDFNSLGRGVANVAQGVSGATSNVAKLAVSVTDFNAFIKPAAKVRLQVITPVPAAPAQAIAPAPVQQAAEVKPAVAITPAPTAPVAQPHISTTNRYAWGNCTWWVSNRRAQSNDPIPNSWGNATTWASRAARDGYIVDHQPSQGAIMQEPYVDGGLGHVAFVESVDGDGTWHISEMNVLGLDVVDHKTVPAAAASNYNFIHDRY